MYSRSFKRYTVLGFYILVPEQNPQSACVFRRKLRLAPVEYNTTQDMAWIFFGLPLLDELEK